MYVQLATGIIFIELSAAWHEQVRHAASKAIQGTGQAIPVHSRESGNLLARKQIGTMDLICKLQNLDAPRHNH